jgi:hypothetical protein
LSLLMLALFGAQERTDEEYRALLEAAGFANVNVRPGAPPWSIVEAVRSWVRLRPLVDRSEVFCQRFADMP